MFLCPLYPTFSHAGEKGLTGDDFVVVFVPLYLAFPHRWGKN
jgi:hypothetical protein